VEKRDERFKAQNPQAMLDSREAAYCLKIFRQLRPQDQVLGPAGVRTGPDSAEERERVRGTVDGYLEHARKEEEKATEVRRD
jgi:asparagine synthase (glutamine-hydrolysing)